MRKSFDKIAKNLRNIYYKADDSKKHPHYFQYVSWSFVSNIVVSVESVLGTHAMLSVVGQSSSEAIVSINYIGKDLVGQLGSLVYLSRVSKHLDTTPRRFIDRALVYQQISLLLECTTPFVHSAAFIPFAGLANIGQNISATGIGAGNAQIIQRLAVDNNIGEIYAKVSLLNTFGSSIGMVIGLVMVYYIPDHSSRLLFSPLLAYLRLVTFRKAMDGII